MDNQHNDLARWMGEKLQGPLIRRNRNWLKDFGQPQMCTRRFIITA